MENIFNNIKYLVGNEDILKNIAKVPPLPLFSDLVVDFFNSLSRRLMSKEIKGESDIFTLGFWLRRASLELAKKSYIDAKERIGWGMVFHIAPSNIPIQFAVSLVYALISGNASVVRVSNKKFHQVDIICREINECIKEYPEIAPYILIIRYDHNDAITKALSAWCDARLIWGGNNTINTVRLSPIPPRSIDLGFADKYSFTVIDADAYLKLNKEKVANDFYNDTYFSDQNACSSPRLIVWIGINVAEAKKTFRKSLKAQTDKRYKMSDIAASNKLLTTALAAIRFDDAKEIKEDNTAIWLEISNLEEDIVHYKENSGYFFEYTAGNLEEITVILKKECQTITYIGDLGEKLRKIVISSGARGVDRIVPVGRGMDLSLVWDGIDLPLALSRQISVV